MKGKVKIFARKAFALLIATAMSVPTAAIAAEDEMKIYDQSSSVMGLAENTENQKETKLLGDNSVQKETDSFKLDMRARLDALDKIIYEVKISKKLTGDQKLGEVKAAQDIKLNFTPNPNSSIKEIKLLSAKALSPQGTKEIDFEENTNKSDLDGLKLKGAIEDEIVLEIVADVRQAEKSRTYDMGVSLFDEEDKLNFSYNLMANKEIIKDEDKEIEKISLDLNEKETNNLKGEIESQDLFGLFGKKETISWTDYLANADKDSKEVSYEFNLDNNQNTTDTKINIDYYENTKDGFILKKEFSQSIDFAKKIEFEIPANYIAKMSLKTKVDKNNTAVKAYSLNGRQVKNPSYKEEEKTLEDDDEEGPGADSEKQEKQNEKDTENQDKKDDQEIKVEDANNPSEKETDTKIVATDSEGKEIPVEIKDNTDEEKREDQTDKISALILNKDSLISKLEEENKLDQIKKTAIEELVNDLDFYNDEKITHQELLDFTKKLAENYNIDKTDLRIFIESILSGLNKQTNKAANLNIDEIIDYAYPQAKETVGKDSEENSEEESQTKDDNTAEKPAEEKAENETSEQTENSAKEKQAQIEEKDPGKTFDEDLAKLKEEAKKEENKTSVLDGFKSLMGLTDLQKADKELKAALADESNGLEEIQNLLDSFETKYKLSRADQAKLMDDNGEAIKALIAKDSEENFRSHIFATLEETLSDKKFTVRTIFQTSNIGGPIQDYQHFKIHLDEKLTVKNPSELKDIVYNGRVIARPKYESTDNTITYNIEGTIPENISIPLEIPVDYNTTKINKDSFDNNGLMTITNSVSGLGVTNPKSLLPEQIDKNGNPAGSIIEPGRKDVIKIIEPDDSNYKVDTDAYAIPVIKDGKLDGYNWTIKVSSDTDLNALGLKVNFTEVVGSGLGKIEKSNIELEDQLENAFGIHDSKHHAPKAGTREITYNFYTPVQGMQEKYMMDISIILTEKGKVGAKRIVMDGWPADKVKEATPIRSGMNNRTTVLGEFTSESAARWTVTDAVSTGDTGTKENPADTKLPWETRKLSTNQTLKENDGTIAVYKIDLKTGKMVQDGATEVVSKVPDQGTNPNANQPVGTIAVYGYDTSFEKTEKNPLSLAGVMISKYKDIYVDQNWNLDEGLSMPAQTLKAVDPSNTEKELGSTTVDEETPGAQATRSITIPNVKVWNIQGVREFTKTQPKIEQTFPTDKKDSNGKTISYYENHNYYDPNTKGYNIHNRGTVEDVPNRASFIIVKTDKKDPKKKLAGARFKLLNGPEVITDANGEAVFNNIAPGTYTIFETKAPNGYKSNQENATINIDKEGRVSLEGGPASISAGSNPTQTVEHGGYPDYMNAMQYATKDNKGKVTTYIFLKANEEQRGGSTDRDTRLNLRMDNGSITNVEVFDVYPDDQRNPLKSAMTHQTADQMVGQLGASVLNSPHTYPINGSDNVYDDFLKKTGYQISLPKERFASDWGFLVKVRGTGDSLSYDWLTNNNTKYEAKLQDQKIVPSTSTDTNKATKITITNEAFETRPVGLTKLDKENNPVAGATFVIKDENGDVISTVTSDKDGKVSFGDMPGGKYTIEETEAPAGYVKSNVIFEVTVDDSKQVTYIPKFKNGSGYPVNGEDYFIKDMEQGQDDSMATVTSVTQDLYVNDKENGSIGRRPGIWEAYFLESLSYTAKINLKNSAPGTRFSIQFDPNLDFTQYFNEFPKIKSKEGIDIADPYFDYTTNKLTYVFNEKSKGGPAEANIKLVGMIPSKYFAQNDGKYNFTVTVAPGQDGSNNYSITKPIVADYNLYYYDPARTKPSQAYYFRDVYKADDGKWYVTALAYYNPHYVESGTNDVLNFNWKTVKHYTAGNYVKWKGDGTTPPYDLTDVKVYRTAPRMGTIKLPELQTEKKVNYNMPLSFGVRPEQDPSTYHLIYSRSINPNQKITNDRNGDVVLNYDPSKLNTWGTLEDKGPLNIQMPSVNNNNKDGYIIEQTFKIDDINKFNNTWRAFNMANGSFNSAFVSKANANIAIGDQTGGEIPKFYSQEVGLFNKKYEPGKFSILKQDETNSKPLEKATFSLTDEDNNVIYRSSGTDGIVSFKDLKPGSYILKEEIPPTGFVKTDRRWNVNVSIDGNVTITEIGLNASGETLHGKDIKIPVGNKPTATEFRVYKKDADNKPLEGAEFKITKAEDGTQVATGKSGNDGVVTFDKKLEKGTYILEETKSPEGYQKLDNKWVVEVDDSNNVKIYTYNEKKEDDPNEGTQQFENSLLTQDGVNWVNVSQRPTDRFITDDNRQTGYADKSITPYKLGTRIVGINKTDNYAIQRYVINPEGKDIDINNALIHREKLWDDNMSWYAGKGKEDVKIYTLDKPVTTNVEDIRLYSYNLTDITDKVDKSSIGYSYSDRLQLVFNKDKLKGEDGDSIIKGKPIVVDVKIPYSSEYGGVGTGMDLNTSEGPSWKSDYYEQVSDIVEGDTVKKDNITDDIKGSYISDDYLDVTNEQKRYEFSIEKVNEEENASGGHDAVTGATFKLVGPKPSEDTKWTESDEKGKVSFKDLVPGIYNLVETGAAQGYKKANTDWQVAVLKNGKIYIRDNNTNENTNGEDRSASEEKNSTLIVGNKDINEVNSVLFNDREANNGPIVEDENALVNRNLNFVNDHAEMSISNPINPFALRSANIRTFAANIWEVVDSNSSTGREQIKNKSNWLETRITEINKGQKRFKQVFLFKDNSPGSERLVEIHRQPEKDNPIYVNGTTVNVYTTNASTIDGALNSKYLTDIKATQKDATGGKPARLQMSIPGSQKGYILVEVETSYSGALGLGSDYKPDRSNLHVSPDWVGDSYSSDAGVNKNVVKEPTYSIVVKTPYSNGEVRPSNNKGIKKDEYITLSVIPNKGYVLDQLLVDGEKESVSDNKCTFQMPDHDVEVKATFKQLHDISLEKEGEGTIFVRPSEAARDDQVTVSVKPRTGYELESLTYSYNGKTIDIKDIRSFTMPDSGVTVKAVFKKIETDPGTKTYKVTLNHQQQEGGTLTANPQRDIKAGDEVAITAKPNTGYKLVEFKAVAVNQPDVELELREYRTRAAFNTTESVTRYFTMPASAVNLTASFTPIPEPKPEDPLDNFVPEEGKDILISGDESAKPVQITNKKDGITPKVIKTDSYGTKLQGARFIIKKMTNDKYDEVDDTFKVLTGTSDEDGNVTFKDEDGNVVKLEKGYYLLTEEKSPDGYKRITAPWKMEVRDKGGRMSSVYKGPTDTPSSYIDDDKKANAKTYSGNDIKVKSRLTYINPESKTYVQRIYIDTREYTGGDFLNVQISPKYKREEIDRPGLPPVTIKEGVKTAYRSTYEILNPGENSDINNGEYDKILRTYDLSDPNMSMVNTARWRPFDWGFDEDQLNIGKGVYIVEVEGYYDDTIIDGMATNEVYIDDNYNFTDADGKPSKDPVKKAPYKKTDAEMNPADYGKIDLHVDFYKGKREFKQLVHVPGGFNHKTIIGETGKNTASYQGGIEAVRQRYEDLLYESYVNQGQTSEKARENAKTEADAWANSKPASQKYANFVSKEAKLNGTEYVGGIVDPSVATEPYHHADTSVNLNPIYSSDAENEVPKDGLVIENEKEKYNITFSKHGRDNPDDKADSQKVTENRLEGAVFKLQKLIGGNYEDVKGSTVASAFNGYFGFRNLEPGRYRLMEVQAPKGYRPIKDALLSFTIETIKTDSGKIVDPETGKIIDIKSINVKFPGDDKGQALTSLYMTDPKDAKKKIKINEVDSKEINMETIIYKSAEATSGKPLKELILVVSDGHEYALLQTKIISDSSGFVSLEYGGANGVYQYVPEKTTSVQDGKLVDFVTSATAKNMGKIINEKPGKGAITINKKDGEGNALEGAKFKLTRLSRKKKEGEAGTDTKVNGIHNAETDANGKIEFKDLPIGNYELVETKTVDGYQNRGQIWHFTVGGKDLDPYSGPIARTGVNLTDQITLKESKMSIIRPDNDPEKQTENIIWPNSAQLFRFDNDFELTDGKTIRPGDYFQVKLSDYTDLYGIYNKDLISGLDIFADGVGTIAKAEYDDAREIITYTFTEYARTYELTDFNTSIVSHIDRFKFKTSQNNVPVGVKMNRDNATNTFKYVNVRFDLGTHFAEAHGTRPNLSSKITYFDNKTGEFEHIFYLNRDQNLISDGRFTYLPDKGVENLRMQVFRVNDNLLNHYNNNWYSNMNYILPPSYAVDVNNLVYNGYIYLLNNNTYYGDVSKADPAVYTFPNGYLQPEDTYIIRVTGSIKDKTDTADYEAQGKIDRYNIYNYPYMGAERHDYVYGLLNENNAEAKLEITATNPKNEISFKKTDSEGRVLKGAKFALVKYNETSKEWTEVENSEKTTKEDGLVKYEKLAPGKYALIEKEAPTGYNKIEGHIEEFAVDKDGIITKEVTRPKGSDNNVGTTPEDGTQPDTPKPGTGTTTPSFTENVLNTVTEVLGNAIDKVTGEETETVNVPIGTDPINVVNYKNIEFVKVDGDDNTKTLAGAVFEIHYKEKVDGKYTALTEKKTVDGEEKEVKMTVTSGKDGKFKLPISKDGYYALVETKAPEGYSKIPGKIREFKLESGSLSVLEKDPLKASLTRGKKGQITSQVLSVDKDNKTFTQRIVINPKHENLTGINNSSYLRILENGWSITPKFIKSDGKEGIGGEVKVALLKKTPGENDKKSIGELDEKDFKKLGAISYDTVGNNTGSRYSLKELLGKETDSTTISTTDTIVVEYTGTLAKGTTKVDQKAEFIIDNTILDTADYSLDIDRLSSDGPIYVDVNKSNITPIPVENKKFEYPLTGGPKAWIGFTILGLIFMTLAGFYYNKKKTIG